VQRLLSAKRQVRRSEAGFSFIEVVIAGLLMLMIAISVLPMFTEAAASNETGREYTQVSNLARSRAEELMQLPFNSAPLTVSAGTSLVTDEYYSVLNKRWMPGTTPSTAGDRALWLRRTTIRQFAVTNLDLLDNPLPAGTPPEGVHVKEIQVEIRGATVGSLFGPSKSLTVRMLKSQ
jgi:type II secretory pathway pseudopilin PulG